MDLWDEGKIKALVSIIKSVALLGVAVGGGQPSQIQGEERKGVYLNVIGGKVRLTVRGWSAGTD